MVHPFSTLPLPGSLALVDRVELHSGGCASSTAIALAKLGVPTTIVAAVGNDEFGRFLIQRLATQGVDTSGMVVASGTCTSATVVLVSADGERSFVHTVGANASLSEANFSREVLALHAVLHFGGALLLPGFDGEPMARVLESARGLGLVTSLDTVWDASGGWYSTLAPCLPHVDVVMSSAAEAYAISGRSSPEAAAEFFLSHGVRWVAIKRGGHGCLLASHDEIHTLPALPARVVDTTGAGDAFAAGFLAGLSEGRDLRSCGLLGRAAATICVGYAGGSDFPLSRVDLEQRSASNLQPKL